MCCQAGGTVVMKESYYKGQSPLKGESTCCPKGQIIHREDQYTGISLNLTCHLVSRSCV